MRGITNRQLIEHLQKLPPDAEAIYRACSDWAPLELEQVTVVTKEDKKIVYRNDQYSDAYPAHMWPKGEEPVFAQVICFPGN